MKQLLNLTVLDFKLIFRDPSLRIFLAMPLLIFGIVLFFLPYLLDQYAAVQQFVPLVLMGASMQTATMFGFIYAFVLIHEKDIQVARVYGVMPVSKTGFVISRMVFPFAVSSIVTLLLLFLQPFYSFDFVPMVLISILSGLFAPLLTIGVSILSRNKIEGMTWFKLLNLLVSIPLAAFFIPKFYHLFGIIPTHWLFQALNQMIYNEGYLSFFLIGLIFILILLFFLIRRFAKVHFL